MIVHLSVLPAAFYAIPPLSTLPPHPPDAIYLDPDPSALRPSSKLCLRTEDCFHITDPKGMGCTNSKSASLGGMSSLGAGGGGKLAGELSPGASGGGGDLRYNMLKANKGDRFHELFEVTVQLPVVVLYRQMSCTLQPAQHLHYYSVVS